MTCKGLLQALRVASGDGSDDAGADGEAELSKHQSFAGDDEADGRAGHAGKASPARAVAMARVVGRREPW